MDDTTAEDWFTADFMEFATSLAGQSGAEPAEDGPDGPAAEFGRAAEQHDLRVAPEQ